jgi:hypothetical protein
MSVKKLGFIAVFVLFVAIIAVVIPAPVFADGGPAVPYDLWHNLKEGQQIAVVTIWNQDMASVDLFISILDKTAESHEVIFFVPIGKDATFHNAFEQDLYHFDEYYTARLDYIIRESVTTRQHAVQALFAGALLTNGAILTPLWASVLLTGCSGAAQQPETTIQTESSEINIYGIDEKTDLTTLIETTGLAPSVYETLSKLKGQKVAIVKLHTQPKVAESETTQYQDHPTSEPGLHLSWSTSLVDNTYTYPLGTGAAWSKPIELTRVYISVPKGVDFDVQYPTLGAEYSGYDLIKGSNIQKYIDIPAYAVDQASGDFGRVWRATYTMSNPTDNIVITVKPQSTLSQFLAHAEEGAFGYSILFALIIGVLIWIFAWIYLMPIFLGSKKKHPMLAWYYALIYPFINFIFIIFPGMLFYLFFLFDATLLSFILVFLVLGGAIIGIFTLIHGNRLGVSRGRAIGAFVLTSLCSNAFYLLLAVGFAWFVSAF